MGSFTHLFQEAPWPKVLEDLIVSTRYKANWRFWLTPDLDRDQGSRGTTLVVQITTPDSYHPEILRTVNHYFPVPPAAYDVRSWRRWLFDQILLVERHEACEFFQIQDETAIDSDDLCAKCSHAATRHDGRDESCADCLQITHRFVQRREDFVYTRPYAPSHGPGNDPYLIREIGTELDVATSFRGEVKNLDTSG